MVSPMSWQPAPEPAADAGTCPGLDTVISPRRRDLGGFEVRRLLPSARRRSIGPFVFWDQMGPAMFVPGRGMDVRPHPHIGLATITYLFAGEILHRDSLGSVQAIRPGEVNWMTAGRGIVHSERTSPQVRALGSELSGIQAWVALPRAQEECEPSFSHHAAATLPLLERVGTTVRVLTGAIYGRRSPVPVASPMFYADAVVDAGAQLTLPAEQEERAIHVAEGRITLAGDSFEASQLLVFRRGNQISVMAPVRAPAAPRRGAAGWATARLVELRLELAGATRACQAGLEGGAVPQGPRR